MDTYYDVWGRRGGRGGGVKRKARKFTYPIQSLSTFLSVYDNLFVGGGGEEARAG